MSPSETRGVCARRRSGRSRPADTMRYRCESAAARGRRFEESASQLPAVVSPVQDGLALAWAAGQIALLAIAADGGDVSRDRPPSPDLTRIVGAPAAHVVPTVPLEPASRVLRTNPSVPAPDRERLRRVDAETVEARVMARRREPGVGKPARGE